MTQAFAIRIILAACVTAGVFVFGEENSRDAAAMSTDAAGWKIFPAAEKFRRKVSDYVPKFEKHFKVVDGVLTGTCGLGQDLFDKYKCEVFEGVGLIWATNAGWPGDVADFDLTLDYKFFQKEHPSDFPDVNIGFRLNAEGEGYYLQWGFLGQVRAVRVTKDGRRTIAWGQSIWGLKGRWDKIRIRAAGPVVKMKAWVGNKPEPAAWSAEFYDDWKGTDEQRFQKGSIALGFCGRKIYDPCVYEFKNVVLKPLTASEASTEKFFDGDTAAAFRGEAQTHFAEGDLAVTWKDDAAIAQYSRDKNLGAVSVTSDGMTLSSGDGEPAFIWTVPMSGYRGSIRVKASAGARPLFAVRPIANDKSWDLNYLDPCWRSGVACYLLNNARHVHGVQKYELKADTWYDLGLVRAHTDNWQIMETGNATSYAVFYSISNMPLGAAKVIGIGVAGKGTVTVQGIHLKP